jgi:hypothetical protein
LAGFLQEFGLSFCEDVARRGWRWVDVAVDKQDLSRIPSLLDTREFFPVVGDAL